jgi:hypothetical protein
MPSNHLSRPATLLLALASLCVFAWPRAAHAGSIVDFDAAWSGPFGNGSATLVTTSEGSGQYLITSMTAASQGGSPITLLPPLTYANNENTVYYPLSSSPTGGYLDESGWGFSEGTVEYNIFYGSLGYEECSSTVNPPGSCLDSTAAALTSFDLKPATSPEPSSLLLLGIDLFGIFAVASFGPFLRRRLAHS